MNNGGIHLVVRRFWRAETGFYIGIWLFFTVMGRSRLFRDPGTFWHTATGHWIFSTGRLIDTDPFSFTFGGKPWVVYEWLGECLMAVLDGIGGLDTLLLATATVLAGLYTWAAHRFLRGGLHWLPTVFLIMLTVAASANHLHVRPHISTIVFLGLTFGWLCDFEASGMGLGRLFWLVPVFWAWSNMHGGVLGGLATMVLALAGWCVFRLAGLESPIERPRQAILVVLLIASCGLTFVVNPYGLRLPLVWLEIMRSPVVARLIEEHAPLVFRSPTGFLILFLGLIYAAALASVRPWRPRVTWLIPLFWFSQAVMRVRHSPLFAITAVLALAEMLPYTRLAAWLARPGRDLFRFRSLDMEAARRIDWRPALLPASVILLAAALQPAGVRAPILGRGWVQLDPKHWPVELLPELRQAEREHPEGTRIFNEFLYGGFLIYYTPGLKVFIDDRCEVYGDNWLMQFSEAMRSNPERVDRWQETYGFPYALVARGTAFDRYLGQSRRWSVVKRTGTATLYEISAREQRPEEHTAGLSSFEAGSLGRDGERPLGVHDPWRERWREYRGVSIFVYTRRAVHRKNH